ncbi:MAG: alpha/beta hydrolase family protein, partial [Longimicrobiales bacterium]
PYSWLHPVMAFPREVEIWDRGGQLVKTIARLPLSEPPIDGVRTGPRELEWKPAEPSTLAWAEALDGGDPRRKVPHRDRIVKLAAPFAGEPIEIAKVEHRLRSIQWLERDGGPLVTEFDRTRRWTRTLLLAEGAEPRVLWSRNQSDRYKDPGTLVQRTLPSGHRAVLQSGDSVFLTGLGASPEGDRPFLDRLDLKTLKTERVFRSAADKYESVVGLASANGSRFLVRHESPTEPPNFSLQSPSGRAALTRFTDRAPQLHRIQKQLVRYERSDGVALSFTLYLPPDYKPGTRLPAVVWAYPREFTDPETAGQVSGSTRRFTRFTGPSHLYLLLAGYAVLDNAAMPVVGDPQTVNNTYIEQIVMNAKAAIDKASDMGVIDRDRAGVGGHSYGAFMTANLLAHSDLFRAGIARSGAHNRTLTPFGFQSERRTLWEAPELYIKMSPLMVANKINEPLLMIHGEADNNSGTFPIQSERMYQAVRGNGGTARLVMLPHEAHGYAARESIEHVLAEMIEWCDRWVKVGRAGGATSGR